MTESRRPPARSRHCRLGPDLDIVAWLGTLEPAWRRAALATLAEEDHDVLDRDWSSWAHDGQRPPAACADGRDWATWVIKGGRGYGKTLAGAQWITEQVAAGERLHIALVGASIDEARRVMVEGRSGLLNVAAPWIKEWRPSFRTLSFTTGAEATLFSGASPDLLRGPEHHIAWCDELAKWPRAQDSWDMLQLGLRLGTRLGTVPRAIVTTTPRAGPVLRAIIDDPATVVTGGGTRANPHIAPAFKARVEALYAGTRMGRQELDGDLLPDAAGALWTVALIERCRVVRACPRAQESPSRLREGCQESPSRLQEGLGEGVSKSADLSKCVTGPPPTPPASGRGEEGEGEDWARTLIAVDPPSGDGTCGIIACARGADGIAHVLADHSVTARSPEGWASAVAAAAAAHATTEVIAEANQGGRMVKSVLLTADPALRVRLVNARIGKTARAEPVAHLFEAGKVRLHGRMPELEAQLLGLIAGGGYEGPGASPDRADAMVWGVGEVMREVRVGVRGV